MDEICLSTRDQLSQQKASTFHDLVLSGLSNLLEMTRSAIGHMSDHGQTVKRILWDLYAEKYCVYIANYQICASKLADYNLETSPPHDHFRSYERK